MPVIYGKINSWLQPLSSVINITFLINAGEKIIAEFILPGKHIRLG
jgi:hypothetical protein